MTKITKDMIIADIIAIDPEIAQFFFAAGLGCAGCPSSKGENLADAGTGHGVDVDALVDQINAFLASKSV